jgi:hypothetical protein
MIQYSLRFLKRFAILIPGIIIAFFSVRDIFPYFDRRLPLGLAVFATYVLGAYLLVPALIRLIRIIRPAGHLPLYCVTPDGFASDPLNIGIIATRKQLIESMQQAGWHVADPHSLKNTGREVLSLIFHRHYENAPVSSLYLFGRRQDIAFEIPVEGVLGGRHHVRFWATTYDKKTHISVRNIHWRKRRAYVQGEHLLWLGAASLDNGVTFIRHNMQVSHMIHPDTNQERELIVQQLKAVGLVDKIDFLKLGKAYKLVNRVWRGSLHSDGVMAVVSLRTRP